MNIFRSMEISASALTAQRYRMDVIGENVANATTTRTADGTPYRRKFTVFEEKRQPYLFSEWLQVSQERIGGAGVRVVDMGEDRSPFRLVFDPGHPDANEDGYVEYPNVDIEKEMVDFISATRSYEANITVLNNFKSMAMKAMEVGR
ncbi:MAG: flagellar basal body rod protein FlgC [Oscillospiraceae bacterium]|nr:flagellar basal body rod protein FlgC [Oscillospiraceae bacterium]